MKPVGALVLYAEPRDPTLSYQQAWPRRFRSHPAFRATVWNVLDSRWPARVRRWLARHRRRYDVVILLHSIFSNTELLPHWWRRQIAASTLPVAYFISNEFKLLPEKMALCEELGVSLLVTQSPSPAVQALYRERLGCAVTSLPYTGLDPDLFRPVTPRRLRPIDVGYRGYDPPWSIGHRERSRLVAAFRERGPALGLELDLSTDPADRFTEPEWAGFLNRCKGMLGSEAGGDYFELTDETRLAVEAWLEAHPGASFEEVDARFFRHYEEPVPIRIISGRNVEAAGTRTVQLLMEGAYSGLLEPDVHYIPLRRELDNIDEAVEKFRDESYCARLTDNAYRLAHEELTYERLIHRFRDALREVL